MNISLKQKIRKKEITIGSWITLGDISIAEIMLKAGFDWLTIDMEHSAITLGIAQMLVQTIELGGGSPLVRVSCNDPDIIKRVMDTGAHGIIVPQVNNKQEAMNAVNSVRYPPRGTRGVGLGRAQGYGTHFERYKHWVETESIVIVQVEHVKAVENLEQILSVEGVDGFIVGPYDLSASLGVPGEFEHPSVIETFQQIKLIAEKSHAVFGIHIVPPNPELAVLKIKEGFTFIAYSLDSLFLAEVCKRGLNSIRSAIP